MNVFYQVIHLFKLAYLVNDRFILAYVFAIVKDRVISSVLEKKLFEVL